MKEGGVIIAATIAFLTLTWQVGMVETPPPACEDVRIVSYLPIPEPEPLMKTPPLGWPIEDRARPSHDEPKVQEATVEEREDPTPRRRHHWRRRRR